jgi:hypothetical protein
MIKQLISDALEKVIRKDEGAAESFRRFVEKELDKQTELNKNNFLAEIISCAEPRLELIKKLQYDLRSNSLQSADAIFKAGSSFNIPTSKLCATTDIQALKDVFKVRNHIIHEMDVSLNTSNRSRTRRNQSDMKSKVNLIFKVAENFLKEADQKLT